MLQQHVTAFPGPNFDESRSLQLADHLGPSHTLIVNLALGYVNAAGEPVQVMKFDSRLRPRLRPAANRSAYWTLVVVSREGIEPSTRRLRVCCFAN